MTQRSLIILLTVILVFESLFIGVLVGFLVSPIMGLALGLGMVALFIVVIPLAMWLVARITGWTRLAALYPEAPPAPDASTGTLTSLSVRWPLMRFNNVVMWHADDHHLHLKLAAPFGKFVPGMSIPWGRVEVIEPGAFFGTHRLEVEGVKLWVERRLVERELAVREALETEPAPAGA